MLPATRPGPERNKNTDIMKTEVNTIKVSISILAVKVVKHQYKDAPLPHSFLFLPFFSSFDAILVPLLLLVHHRFLIKTKAKPI